MNQHHPRDEWTIHHHECGASNTQKRSAEVTQAPKCLRITQEGKTGDEGASEKRGKCLEAKKREEREMRKWIKVVRVDVSIREEIMSWVAWWCMLTTFISDESFSWEYPERITTIYKRIRRGCRWCDLLFSPPSLFCYRKNLVGFSSLLVPSGICEEFSSFPHPLPLHSTQYTSESIYRLRMHSAHANSYYYYCC